MLQWIIVVDTEGLSVSFWSCVCGRRMGQTTSMFSSAGQPVADLVISEANAILNELSSSRMRHVREAS